MQTAAVVIEEPGRIDIRTLTLRAAAPADAIVETVWSGISTGTEKMFWAGTMPPFPGLSYPLVPGYESVGRVVAAGPQSGVDVGDMVFVPGASCYREAAGLFGATADRIVVEGQRLVRLPATLGEEAVLLSLAATAHHAIARADGAPDLVIGHGVLGRLIARIVIALGHPAPRVWEQADARRAGGIGYDVVDAANDAGRRFASIIDASGTPDILDMAVSHLDRGGSVTLAGFYGERLSFAFPQAFMREARFTIAAEFRAEDVTAVLALIASGRLDLSGLVTHHRPAANAAEAYATAFGDPDCLKMVIDWRAAA